MGTLTSSLSIALSGLDAAQDAISVASNNIANVNTPGYSREVANLATAPSVEQNNLTFGTGVQVQSVTSLRDSVLDLRVNQETQQQGQLNAFIGGGQQIQQLFNQTTGAGLQAPITAFFSSLTQLSASPSDPNARQTVLTAAQNLATTFNQTSNSLSALQQNTNISVSQTVAQINSLTTQLATLNGQVAANSGGGENAGPLIDQRQQLLNQLSNLVDISEINAGNGSLTITTSSGAPLVVGNQSFALSTQPNAANGENDVYSRGSDITTQITSGQLAGQLQLRDQEIPAIQNSLDTLAYGLATNVNTVQEAGTDLNGAAGGPLFTPPTTVAGTAATLSVAITDPSKIAASLDGSAGDNANANALAALQNQNIVAGQTPLNYYSGLVFKIGNDVSTALANQASGAAALQQVQNLQGGVSGVDINEEAANLVRYQNAYQANAEVSATIDTLLEFTITNFVP
ncbi:MAG: flagellar hook-associated protein FlgK [Candidatus Acidiferrum sp.]|jgi:flagellar hook-associated protein 1 FlgK